MEELSDVHLPGIKATVTKQDATEHQTQPKLSQLHSKSANISLGWTLHLCVSVRLLKFLSRFSSWLAGCRPPPPCQNGKASTKSIGAFSRQGRCFVLLQNPVLVSRAIVALAQQSIEDKCRRRNSILIQEQEEEERKQVRLGLSSFRLG